MVERETMIPAEQKLKVVEVSGGAVEVWLEEGLANFFHGFVPEVKKLGVIPVGLGLVGEGGADLLRGHLQDVF